MPEQKSRKKKGGARSDRREKLSLLLGKIEAKLESHAEKATLGDFIRLTQLERELDEDEPPLGVIIRWEDQLDSSVEQ